MEISVVFLVISVSQICAELYSEEHGNLEHEDISKLSNHDHELDHETSKIGSWTWYTITENE